MKIKLIWVWLGWFAATCLFSFMGAGMFFRDLYQATFDRRLRQDMVKLVLTYKPMLAGGLARNPIAISVNELDLMQNLAKEQMVAQVVYLNQFGKVRWHRQPQYMGLAMDEYLNQTKSSDTVVKLALTSRQAEIRPTDDNQYYELAVPFYLGQADKHPVGMLWLLVSRQSIQENVAWGMGRYRLGALVVALLIGTPLYLFFYNSIVKPAEALQEGLDALSLKNLEWKVALRHDEFGDIAAGIDGFLQKVRVELTALRRREEARSGSEKQWWAGIFAVMGEGRQAIVVDEDNNVLFTNIPVAGPAPERRHLLDVVDNQQQDILRLVGVALERPNDMVQGETLFQNRECKVRIVHLGDAADLKRTLIYFEPKREESGFAQLRAGSDYTREA